MTPTPTRTIIWSAEYRPISDRISNLARVIPTIHHRAAAAQTQGDADAADQYKGTLTNMLDTLSRLAPNHPHLSKYSLSTL